jgi:hypothetical protein
LYHTNPKFLFLSELLSVINPIIYLFIIPQKNKKPII